MADADRDSDLGDDSPVSARSEGESSGEQSCESSDEGVGRDAPAHAPMPHALLQTNHQQINQINQINQLNQINQINQIVNHQQRNSPRPHEREVKVRDDFESLKSSLHPHLSSLASLAQGAPLSTPGSVYALAGGGAAGGFPYAPPAFLAPAPPPPAQPVGSASSSSSEGSAAGWSFEEQYKQVRQLYEISDEPKRKDFLDDLFSFMQKRGTPINRLPIMAKSVLDLFELYNLVIARGGLVEVINKKLWQEIIKGLRLPSSITSAAFTLRTQYMKYLYDYECEKNHLSTRTELDAAIEGNKREGRRASGQYDAQAALAMVRQQQYTPPLNRGVPATLAQLTQHMQPLSLAMGGAMGGPVGAVPRMPPLLQQQPMNQHELEFRVREYVKALQQSQMLRNGSESPPNPNLISPRDAMAAIDASRIALWSIYNNNNASPPQMADLEPQREALNLSESPTSSHSGGVKREREPSRSPLPAPKRRTPRPPSPSPARAPSPPSPRAGPAPAPRTPPTPAEEEGPTTINCVGLNGTSFKVTSETTRDVETGDPQLTVSIEINGVKYEGTLFRQTRNGQNGHRQMVS